MTYACLPLAPACIHDLRFQMCILISQNYLVVGYHGFKK